jgi:hypothetical protein
MTHDLALIVAGLCMFALAAMLLPEGFAMPADDEGDL